MGKMSLQERFKVTIVKAEEVATLFHTTVPKIKAAILNGTLPIGFVAEGPVDRIIIIEERLIAWLEAMDLKGGRRLQ